MNYSNDPDFAVSLDKKDALAGFRKRFHFPELNGKPVLYFCGNSLGLQPLGVKEYIDRELDNWARLAVEGHFRAEDPWFSYQDRLKQGMAEIVGGKPEEVAVMNSLTVNLHLLLVSFYRPTRQRFKIICEHKAFRSVRSGDPGEVPRL
jgi:kynureninase